MLFSSISFLFYFLPPFLILYFAVPNILKNTVLLIASLLFYAWGEPKYGLLMMATILCGYTAGRVLEQFRSKRSIAKLVFILSAVFFIGILGYFKYANFFISNFHTLTGIAIPVLNITLPIGISFYTFQILSYVIDVYRGDIPAQRNPITLAAYVAMFPQLIAGPIVRYAEIAQQLEHRTHTMEKAASGIRYFIIGLSKKILLANQLGELCQHFQTSEEKSVLLYWLYAVAYALQVYFDFSGYSDMAIGLGKILGFTFPENFRYPYTSKSITAFWRRWHISLGTWFRDYVYIPLGGNRVCLFRRICNILVVWILTGFWHGAAWNFIVWGLFFAVFLLIEKRFLLRYLEQSHCLPHLYVLFTVVISFVIFGAGTMSEAMNQLQCMFGFGVVPIISDAFFYYLRSYAVILFLAILGATPLPKMLFQKIQKKCSDICLAVLEPCVLAALLLTATAFLVNGSFNPFLYFRF